MVKRLLFIFNPRSGKGQIRQNLSDIVDVFIKAGYRVNIHSTQGKNDAMKQVIKYGDRYNLIVCSGGDGTLSEVISGVMFLQKRPCISYIPAGSTNDFAAGLDIPKNMIKAAKVAVKGSASPIDIGTFNDKTFIYVAAFGAFTEVSYNTSQDTKNLFGHPAYIIEGLKSLPTLKKHHLTIKYNNKVIEDDFIYGMITNAVSVGGFRGITGQKVSLDDGLFECTLIKMPKNPIELQSIISVLLGMNTKSNKVIEFKTSKLYIKSEEHLPWVLDGEYGGSPDKIVIKNNRKTLNVMTNWERKFF